MMKREKNISVKIIFDRKRTATKASSANRKKAAVVIEVYYDGSRIFLPTNVKIFKDQFKNGRVCNCPQHAEYNERIQLTKTKVDEYINRKAKANEKIELPKLKEYISLSASDSDTSFLDYMETCICKSDIADNTRKKHHNILRRLRAWGGIKSFSDISVGTVMEWHSEAVKAASQSSFSVNYDRVLRIYVRKAYKEGLIPANPYRTWAVPKYTPAHTHRYLSLEELRKIEQLASDDEYLKKARDLFVFQANTGLAYVDTQTFAPNSVKSDGKGQKYYMGKRQKTEESFFVPLSQSAISILGRYDGIPPQIDLTIYNVKLKKVAELAGIKEKISSHWARHTFAMICLNNGMSVEVLAKILGHSDIKTTQIYAAIVQDTVTKQFNEVMEKLGES